MVGRAAHTPAQPAAPLSQNNPATHSALDTQAAPRSSRGVSAPGHSASTSNTSGLAGSATCAHGAAANRAKHAAPCVAS